MKRLFFGLLILSAFGSVRAAEEATYPKVSRDSAFIQRLLQRQVSADRQDTRIAALVLYRTGNLKDGEALDQFEKRRLAARFLGEPFEFSGTLAQVIDAERTAEPLSKVVARALQSVTIEYAAPDTIPPRPTPESRMLGNGIWATGATNAAIEMPMVIRHSLHAAATSVGIQIGKWDSGGPQPYYLFLTCKPAGATGFAPGVSQAALCTGGESRGGMDLAIQAVLERQISAPLPAYSFMTREADLYGDYFRINDEARSAADLATAASMVASARCEDLGNCEAVAKARSAARWQAARPGILIALAISVFLLAAFASSRAPVRENTGWFVNSLSVLVVFVSTLAIVVMFPATAPGLGLEGVLYYGFLIFGLLPHLVCVGIIGASVAGGGTNRLRIFALTLGLLTPALVWAGIVAFAR